MAAAAFRGPAAQLSSSQTHNLAQLLQSSLPNLSNTSQQNFSLNSRNKDTQNTTQNSVLGPSLTWNKKLDEEAAERKLEQLSSSTNTAEQSSGHVLGLDCYSSSDED